MTLYGNQPAPRQDLVDLYGPQPEDTPQTEPLPPFTISDLEPLPWFAQIPDPEEVEPVPKEPAEQLQITITIPTSHVIGAISTVRSIATVSSSNDYFTQ